MFRCEVGIAITHAQTPMPKQFGDGAHVHARHRKVAGERVAQVVETEVPYP